MTTEVIVAQAFNCSALMLFGLFLCQRYNVTIGRRATRRAYQYRLFSLRDRVINLVVTGVTSEDDEDWKELYEHVNQAAHATSIQQMTHGLSFVLGVLDEVDAPTEEELEQFDFLSENLQELWVEYAHTVLTICYEASMSLRIAAQFAFSIGRVRACLKRKWPSQSNNYRQWRACSTIRSDGHLVA